MYNSEVKERFITEFSTSESMRASAYRLFQAFEKYEKKWAADLCTRSAEDIQPILNNAVGMRENSKHLRMHILASYIRWCTQNQVAGATDSSDNIDVSTEDKMRRQTVANPIHLQVYLDEVFRPESEQTVDNTWRCFYWLAFGGATEEEAFNTTVDDVRLEEMVVRYNNGKEILIYREAVPAFINCMRLKSFTLYNPAHNNPLKNSRDRAEGNILLRNATPTIDVKGFRVSLSKKSKRALDDKRTKLKLSHYRVWLSGSFYRLYEKERAGFPEKYIRAEFRKLGKAWQSEAKNDPKTISDYRKDYDCWKRIFC